MREEKKMNKTRKDYEMFHKLRIMSVLFDQQFPANDQNSGVSDRVNILLKKKKDKKAWICSSLFELGIISYEEFEALK